MTARQLRSIIERGETDTVEFKRKFSGFDKIAKEMIALANTRGGWLMIGIDDDGSVVGVDSEKSEIELATTAAEFYCEPPVEHQVHIVDIEGTDVVAIEIPESRSKPHKLANQNTNGDGRGQDSVDTRVYIRQNDRSVIASREVARVLSLSSPDSPPLRLEIGDIERILFAFLEQHGRVTLRQYRHLVNISQRRASRSLVRLVRAGLIRIFTDESEDYYTLA